MEVVRSKIRAMVRYTMALTPFTVRDMTEQLDGAIARVVRECLGLPKSFPKAGIQFNPNHGGAGVGTLMSEYVQANCASLTQAMNDQRPLGEVTRALTALQAKTWGSLPAHELNSKQAKVMQEAGLCLQAGAGITSSQRSAGPGAWEALLEILKSSEAELDWLSKGTWRYLGPMRELGINNPWSSWTPPARSSSTHRTSAGCTRGLAPSTREP
jgi:hypothetical protein